MPIPDDINLMSNPECAVFPRKSHAVVAQVCGELRFHHIRDPLRAILQPAVYGRINGEPRVSQCEAE